MRRLTALGLLAAASAAPAQPAADGRLQADPRRPGFWVIKPQPAGTVPAPAPANVATLQETAPGRAPVAAPVAAPKPAGPAPLNGAAPTAVPLPGAAPAVAPKPADGVIKLETWDKIYIKDQHVGYFHVTVKEHVRDGKAYLWATKESRLWVARFGQKVEQRGEDSSMESADDGRVLTTSSTQGIGREQMLTVSGKVEGNQLRLKVDGAIKDEKMVPWPAEVLGVAGEAVLFAEKKPKPGDKFSYLAFEARVGRVVKFDVVANGYAALKVPGAEDRKVLHLSVAMEPIGDFKLAPAALYVDAESFEPLLMEQDVPSFGGRMKVARTDKASATAPVGKVPDLFDVQSIRLNKPLADAHGLASVTYRVTTSGDVPAERLFPADARQKQANAAGKSVEVTATPGPSSEAVPEPGPENLAPNFFVDWETPRVKQLAANAVANLPPAATPLDKAKAVERWVRSNMRSTEFSQAMATCSNVADSLSGDCSEYSMLSAGMCRALGIPSRTALGVVYAQDRSGAPYLAYHVWFEVYADGRWHGLDATLGRGGVGPGHLKISDAHWHGERSFAPLLPVLAVLQSGPKVEVLAAGSR